MRKASLVCYLVFFIFCSVEKVVAQEKLAIKSSEERARDKVLTLASGEWVSRSLYVATKLGIADLLTEPKSIDELAKLTSSDRDSLYRLLRMLASFGVFEEIRSNVFANTETSRFLAKSSPNTLNSLILFYGEDIHKSWEELFSSIQTGIPAFELAFKKPVFSYFKENKDRAILFQQAMKEKTEAVVKSALSTYDFSKFSLIYDIGGGYGQFMQPLLNKYKNLSGVLFDLPEVIEKVKEQNLQLFGQRCQLLAGDFFVGIPGGADAYLLKSILHDWDDEQCEQILRNCYKAMRSDSRLLIIEVVLQPQAQYANCMDVLMLMITGGKERTLNSFKHLCENCGFILEGVYPTATEFSILEFKKI